MVNKLERPSRKVHVRLFEDQLDEIRTYYPQANLSEILRISLDQLLTKAKARREEKTNG